METNKVVLRTELVRNIASRMIRRLPAHIRFDDLYSAGLEALAVAAMRFDPARGVDFETYAKHRVGGAMLDELRKRDTVSRDRRRAIREGTDDPDAPPVARLVDIAAAAAVADSAPSAEDALDHRRALARMRLAVATLPSRLRLVYRLRIAEQHTLRQIADQLGVTEARACQLVGDIVRQLRAQVVVEPETIHPTKGGETMGRGGANNEKARGVQQAAFRKRWAVFLPLAIAGRVPEVFDRRHLVGLNHKELPSSEVDNFLDMARAKDRITLTGQRSPRQFTLNLSPKERLPLGLHPFFDQVPAWKTVLSTMATLEDAAHTLSTTELTLAFAEHAVEPTSDQLAILTAQYVAEGLIEKVEGGRFQITEAARLEHVVQDEKAKPLVVTPVPVAPPEEEGPSEDEAEVATEAPAPVAQPAIEVVEAPPPARPTRAESSRSAPPVRPAALATSPTMSADGGHAGRAAPKPQAETAWGGGVNADFDRVIVQREPEADRPDPSQGEHPQNGAGSNHTPPSALLEDEAEAAAPEADAVAPATRPEPAAVQPHVERRRTRQMPRTNGGPPKGANVMARLSEKVGGFTLGMVEFLREQAPEDLAQLGFNLTTPTTPCTHAKCDRPAVPKAEVCVVHVALAFMKAAFPMFPVDETKVIEILALIGINPDEDEPAKAPAKKKAASAPASSSDGVEGFSVEQFERIFSFIKRTWGRGSFTIDVKQESEELGFTHGAMGQVFTKLRQAGLLVKDDELRGGPQHWERKKFPAWLIERLEK